MVYEQILASIFAAVTYALTGKLKYPDKDFDWYQFGGTIILGVILGIIYTLFNVPFDIGMSYMTQLGGLSIIINLLKAVARRLG